MGTIAAILGGIGGLCAILGILIGFDVAAELDINDLGYMFWFVLSALLFLAAITMGAGRGGGGNGIAGVGWSLGGLSAITRCPRTKAQDGAWGAIEYTDDDRFCLDGKRLTLFNIASGDGAAVTQRIQKVLSDLADLGPNPAA